MRRALRVCAEFRLICLGRCRSNGALGNVHRIKPETAVYAHADSHVVCWCFTSKTCQWRIVHAHAAKTAALSAAALIFASAAFAQVSSIEGDVGEDGTPFKGALVNIERKDIKGHYQVKSDKKGHYFHTGLPLGNYKLVVEVDGKDVDSVDNVRTKLGDSTVIDFDLQKNKQKQQSLAKAAETGTLTKEQSRDMSPEEKAKLEKAVKEREQALSKNKA